MEEKSKAPLEKMRELLLEALAAVDSGNLERARELLADAIVMNRRGA